MRMFIFTKRNLIHIDKKNKHELKNIQFIQFIINNKVKMRN